MSFLKLGFVPIFILIGIFFDMDINEELLELMKLR